MQRVSVKTSASKGIAFGEVYMVKRNQPEASRRLIEEKEKPDETDRFVSAIEEASLEVGKLADRNAIFAAHREMLEDPALKESVLLKITAENKNAEWALAETEDEFGRLFAEIDDEYLKERAADIRDVCSRIMDRMKGTTGNLFEKIDREVIVVAEDLLPSDTALMDFSKVRGLVTRLGGQTSHVCIIARNKGIPAIVGLGDGMPAFQPGDFVILDGLDNQIIINPEKKIARKYRNKAFLYFQKRTSILKEAGLPATTTDGKKILVMGNAGSVDEVEKTMQYGADGIGLFRSEQLFMQSKGGFPDEEPQFAEYRKALEACKGKSIIIRTLDIGGDKSLPYYLEEKEENPFLGWRGIRFCLDRKDVFKTQLRALLRASAFGNLKIMFPMIISVEEFREAKSLLENSKEELRSENIDFNENIETGVMIETPAAVMIAEDLAREADFFSIGTNDLIQYTLAVDRLNEKVSQLYNPFHPAILRSIKKVADAATKHGKPVGICGEMAGNQQTAIFLLGTGLSSLSISAGGIPEIKQMISSFSYKGSQELAAEVCRKSTADQVSTSLTKNDKRK